MRIVYDNIVFAIQKFGGISVVWQELLSRVRQAAQVELKYIDVNQSLVAENYSRSKLDIDEKDVLSVIKCPMVSRYLPVSLTESQPFIFHSSYYRYCANPKAINITTVHDFTYEYFVKGLKQKVHTWQYMDTVGSVDEGHLIIFDRTKEKSWDERIWHKLCQYNGHDIMVWGM